MFREGSPEPDGTHCVFCGLYPKSQEHCPPPPHEEWTGQTAPHSPQLFGSVWKLTVASQVCDPGAGLRAGDASVFWGDPVVAGPVVPCADPDGDMVCDAENPGKPEIFRFVHPETMTRAIVILQRSTGMKGEVVRFIESGL